MVFWDRGRAKELLGSNELAGCRETGWLERIFTQVLSRYSGVHAKTVYTGLKEHTPTL